MCKGRACTVSLQSHRVVLYNKSYLSRPSLSQTHSSWLCLLKALDSLRPLERNLANVTPALAAAQHSASTCFQSASWRAPARPPARPALLPSSYSGVSRFYLLYGFRSRWKSREPKSVLALVAMVSQAGLGKGVGRSLKIVLALNQILTKKIMEPFCSSQIPH